MEVLLKRAFLIGIFISFAFLTNAQFQSAEIGIDGLTCSQCSRSVEMQFRKLPFIQKIEANLKETSFHISFSEKSKVELDKIAESVKNAGFSVRYIRLHLDPESFDLSKDYIQIRNSKFYIIPDEIEGLESFNFQVIAQGFLPKKEWNAFKEKYPSKLKNPNDYLLKPLAK